MKKIILAITFLAVCSAISFAQCDKKLTINSSKTEYLDADSVLQRTVEENTVIEISKTDIIISPGDKRMTATISSDACNWKIPFVEGKTVLNAIFNDEQGNVKKATITIEGKEGKLTLFVQNEGRPYLIRVPIDKFEERK